MLIPLDPHKNLYPSERQHKRVLNSNRHQALTLKSCVTLSNTLNFLGLSLLICKVGVMVAAPHGIVVRIK